MATIIDTVNMAMNLAGFRSGLANPGQWIPEITEPVVAVSLEQVDAKKYEVTVRVEVVSPVALGGTKCQEALLKVVHVLHGMGARCSVTGCEFDAKTELFSMAALAAFYGDVLDTDWDASKSCRVNWGGGNVGGALSFTAWRETESSETPLALAKWHFRMEENLDGTWPEVDAYDPFTIEVIAGEMKERYTGCVVTSQERYFAEGHLRQVRQGTATARETV